MHELLRLDGLHSCAFIEFEAGRVPVWRHFGGQVLLPRLLSCWAADSLQRLPPGSLDRLTGIPLMPCFGDGLAPLPALRAHQDGVNATQEMVAVSFERVTTEQSQTLVVHLHDATENAQATLEATLTLTLHRQCDMLTVTTALKNSGQRALQVDFLAAGTVPAPAVLQDIGSFHGQWAHEFQWYRARLGPTGWRQQNRTGRTSHETPPACFLLAPAADDHQGEAMAAHLSWSGNHCFSVGLNADGSPLLQAGEWLAPGEVRLQPGQSLHTPPLCVTWSEQGLNGVTNNFHQFVRQTVLRWPGNRMSPRPVHLNTWEAVYFAHDEAVLRELATQGAALGAERFVLDDGWFVGRANDRSSLGDWWPDENKYPRGLGPLIAHVLGLGMSFGLWVEPEMVNPDSELFRQHPDWALQTRGRPLQLGRNQLVLDISNSDVTDYLFKKLSTLLTENAISYVKWDMNRALVQAEGADARMAYRNQVVALYALLARVRQAHPLVEIESCASGGGRMDLSVLEYTQRFWTSDNNDAVSRVSIQSGAARLFPLEVLGAHVGPAPAHATGRTQSMDFRCAVACFGHMGIEADVRQLNASERVSLTRWIALYKSWRDVIHGGIFHQGTTANGAWWMVLTVQRCLLAVFTLTAPASMHCAPLRLPCLVGDTNWQIRLCGRAGQERARSDVPATWLDALQSQGVASSSDELRHIGLPLPNMHPESALVFSFERISPT